MSFPAGRGELKGPVWVAYPQLALPDVSAPTQAEVHLWAARFSDFAGLGDDLAKHLSESERARAGRYRFAEPRRRFIAGRSLLRALLGHFLGEPAAVLQIDVGPHGKPYLAGPREDALRFSVAHSGDLIVVAVAFGRDVGVDVEALGVGTPVGTPPPMTAMMRRLYSEAELRWLDRHPSGSVDEAMLSLWTCKEAFGKALGTGLVPPTLALDAVLGVPGAVSDLPDAWGCRDGERAWAIRRLSSLNGYVGALVVELPAESRP